MFQFALLITIVADPWYPIVIQRPSCWHRSSFLINAGPVAPGGCSCQRLRVWLSCCVRKESLGRSCNPTELPLARPLACPQHVAVTFTMTCSPKTFKSQKIPTTILWCLRKREEVRTRGKRTREEIFRLKEIY